ncbi:MAG: hypothetical protein R3B68_01790 [Phycisphaerales bacterium]
MPLTVNVGLSRKASQNYASRGVSLNLTAEMDQALLAHPARLQQEIAGLYRHVEEALARQESGEEAPQRGTSRQRADTSRARANGHSNGHNGHSNGHGHNGNGHGEPDVAPPATASQIRALRSMCRKLEIDLDEAADEELGVPAADLDIRQASRLIDALKARGTSLRRERRG